MVIMDGMELLELQKQLNVLKEVAGEYPGRTIENIIVQLEARLKEYDMDEVITHNENIAPLISPNLINEKVLIFDTKKKTFVNKGDVSKHDKSNLEVVVFHRDGAFIVSKKSSEKFAFKTNEPTGNYIERQCDALLDFNGKKNTELLVKAGLDVHITEGYYIPALGELVVMCRNIIEINNCLKLIGGDRADMDCYYWSSSERYRIYAWFMYFGGSVYDDSKTCKFVTRTVAPFAHDVSEETINGNNAAKQ